MNRIRRWWRYHRALAVLADEHLDAGWNLSPAAWERLKRQAREL